jgi:hypothetical protein
MEPESLLLCKQQPATGPYSEHEFSSHPYTVFLEDAF